MKKIFNTLKNSGRLDIQIDYHKGFKETAEQYINSSKEFEGINAEKMIENNSIIRIEFFPNDKPMNALAFSHDIELALKDVFNQWKLWKPKSE